MSLSYPISLTNAVGSSTGGHIIYLFAGSNRGGERAAAIYSLLGTAKLNGINPERYLRYVLSHIADHPINRIAELLPWNIPATHSTDLKTDT